MSQTIKDLILTNISSVITISSLLFGIWQFRLNRIYKKRDETRSKRYDLYVSLFEEFNKLDNYIKSYYLKISPYEVERQMKRARDEMEENRSKYQKYRKVFDVYENILDEIKNLKESNGGGKSKEYSESPEFQKHLKKLEKLDFKGLKQYEEEVLLAKNNTDDISIKIEEVLPKFEHDKEKLSKIFSSIVDKIIQTANLRVDSSNLIFRKIIAIKHEILAILQIPNIDTRKDEYNSLFKSILDKKYEIEDLMTKELKK